MNTAEMLKIEASLLDLIAGFADLDEDQRRALDVTISGVKLDSRQVCPGDLFIACFGHNHDARDYIKGTIKQGAVAVLAEAGGDWQGLTIINGVPVLAIDKLAARMSSIADRFFDHPSEKLTVFGVTGTNGKTSCSQFLARILTELGYRCGVIGTLGYGVAGDLKETHLTTPDAIFTQQALAGMAAEHINPVAMEVSSVGLHQHRVAAVRFDTAIFTNISRDHLDYHSSMAEYADSKRRLFTMPGLRCAAINLDDPYAPTMLNAIAGDVEIITYSQTNKAATVHAEQLAFTRDGYQASIHTPLGQGQITGSLLGAFNFSNVLAVVAALSGYLRGREDFSMAALCKSISGLTPVDGRMEIIGKADGVTAVVDYAHTPDGLRSALEALRLHFEGRIWCVFGCGGNRDQGKRPLMGEIAEQHADALIIADDNPRREDGDSIVEHILSGISDTQAVTVIRDRARAINYALSQAVAGDVVLVAGKGHETYQDIDGVKHMFSDAKQLRLALKDRAAATREAQQ